MSGVTPRRVVCIKDRRVPSCLPSDESDDNEKPQCIMGLHVDMKCAISCTPILKCIMGIQLCSIGCHRTLKTIFSTRREVPHLFHIVSLFCLSYTLFGARGVPRTEGAGGQDPRV